MKNSEFKRFQESLRGSDEAWEIVESLNAHIQKPNERFWDMSPRTRSFLGRLRSKIDRLYWDDQEDNPLQVDCKKGWCFDPEHGDFYTM